MPSSLTIKIRTLDAPSRRSWRCSLFVALLHNSEAGDEDHSAEAITALIANAGHEVAYHSIDGPSWERTLDEDPDLVAIAGGDGTVGAVLTAMAKREQVLVTVLPLGSANNIARVLGVPDRPPEELVAGWATATRRRFRLGDLQAPNRNETFVETVGGGLFAAAIKEAERVQDDDDDKVELGLRVLRRLVDELPTQPWQLKLDGVEHHGSYLAVETMVIGETGARIPLAPAARPDDRRIDVVLIRDEDRDPLREYFEARLAAGAQPSPQFEVHRCQRAELEPLTPGCMRVDDELWDVSSWTGAGQAVTTVAPVAIEILAPR
jgi:diacylglycerol kinase (ATP)